MTSVPIGGAYYVPFGDEPRGFVVPTFSDPANGVKIQVVALRDSAGLDHVLCAVETDEDARRIYDQHVETSAPGEVGWFEFVLQGPAGPHLVWPEPDAVYLILDRDSSGDPTDPNFDAKVFAVYTDQSTAEAEALAKSSPHAQYLVHRIPVV